jgi:murein DD-endopeptidase MepM/ murein hydrolase activator NlpD
MATSRKGRHRRSRQRRHHLPVAAGTATVAAAVIGSLTMSTAGASIGSDQSVSALTAPSRPSAATMQGSVDPLASITTATQSLTQAAAEASSAGHEKVRAAQKKAKAAEAKRLKELQRKRAAERAARDAERRERLASMYTKPLDAYQVATAYGTRGWVWSRGYHTGLDLTASYGTPIKAVHSGQVTFVGWEGAYGNKVEITHPDGTQTWYAHMSATAVSGGAVTTGQVIGYVGSTGNSYGNHLHLEVHSGGGAELDPYTWLQERGISL